VEYEDQVQKLKSKVAVTLLNLHSCTLPSTHKHKDLHDFSYQVSREPFAFPRRAATAWLPDRAPIDYTVSTSPADAQLAGDCCLVLTYKYTKVEHHPVLSGVES